MRTVCPPGESAINQILALVWAQVLTRVASFSRYMKGRRVTAAAVALVGVLVLASGWLTPGAVEANPGKGAASDPKVIAAARRTTTFGTLGIVDGQTVRLSAVRAGDDDPAALCKVDLRFFDTQGDRQGGGVSVDLQPRQAEFFDLSRADVQQETVEPRAQIYAVVDVTSEAKKDEPACHVAMSIEVFDQNDGRTQIYQGAFTSLAARFRLGARIQNCCTICCRSLGDVCTDERSSCVDMGQTPICPKCT